MRRRNAFAEVARTSNVLMDTLHRIVSEMPVNIDVEVLARLISVIHASNINAVW